ncbi:MAG: XDD4 family exosortase-dependent surface protein, partial [Planctomycetia bacterium]
MHTLCLTHRIVLATKVLLPWIGILVAATVFAVLPAEGGTIISGTGQTLVSTSPNVYRTVSASADLSISGTTLTVVLNNTSPTDTIFRAEALSSFYFDIVR